MANVLNRTTFEYRESVNTPDYSPADWIINPTQQEISDAAIQRQALIDAQMAADAPYQYKSKEQIMTELWRQMIPVTEDVTGSKRVFAEDGTMSEETYVIQAKDTPEVIQAKLERSERWQAALITAPFQMFNLFLDNNDYDKARLMGQKLVSTGYITQADYDILDGILPLKR